MHIKSGTFTVLSGLLATRSIFAIPTRRFLQDIDVTNNALVFDAPAFQDPNNPSLLKASVQAFVSLRAIPLTPVVDGFTSLLKDAGVDITDAADRLSNRVKLFAAIGLPGKQVNLKLDGCGNNVRAHQLTVNIAHISG